MLITLAPDAPDWATSGGRGGNYKVDQRDFADFARAVGKRYSGVYSGLPRVTYWSIWNEPNHIFFIKPRSQAPRVYRRLVERGLPALKSVVPGAKVFVGELAPVGTATKVIGPLRFVQQWLCLDKSFKRLRGAASRKAGCNPFKRVNANGFAHHPYGPAGLVFRGRDIVNMVGDPPPRERARQGRARRPDQPRSRHLQHRVRLPDQPARPVHRHDAGPRRPRS